MTKYSKPAVFFRFGVFLPYLTISSFVHVSAVLRNVDFCLCVYFRVKTQRYPKRSELQNRNSDLNLKLNVFKLVHYVKDGQDMGNRKLLYDKPCFKV